MTVWGGLAVVIRKVDQIDGLVGALQPALMLLVAGPMFGEPVTASIIGWSLAAIAGVVIVVSGSSGAPVWSVTGDLLAVGALVAWTIYFIASKRVSTKIAPFVLSAVGVVAVGTTRPSVGEQGHGEALVAAD